MQKATLRVPIGGYLPSVRMPVLRRAKTLWLLVPRQQHHFRLRDAVLFRFRTQAVLMMGMAVLLLVMPEQANGLSWPNPKGEPKDQVWLISTHPADWRTDLSEALSTIRYWRLASSGEWEATDQETFFAALASPMPTVIYIHGNWARPETAIQQAWTIYHPLGQAAGNRQFRLLVWCWPAERISARLLTDLRFKAGRSDVEAYLLARHLERMAGSEPILLVGYSFGARVITGALHLVGGGRLMGRTVRPEVSPASESSGLWNPAGPEKATRTDQSPTPGRFRAILAAAAIGKDWLLPGGRHQQALSQLEKLLVTVNRADPALRWYPALEPCDSPALGWAGPKHNTGPREELCADSGTAKHSPDSSTPKIEVLWVTCSVGNQHDWRLYLQTPELQARLAEYLFDSPRPHEAP